MALGEEDGLEARSAAQGFGDQVQALEGDQFRLAARRALERGAQLLDSRVLLAFYGSDRHLGSLSLPLGDCSLLGYVGFSRQERL